MFDKFPGANSEKRSADQETILTQNLSSLANIFEMEDKNHAHTTGQRYADRIMGIIQMYTDWNKTDQTNRTLKNPYEFLASIRRAEQKALEENRGDAEMEPIVRELFSRMNMPNLPIPEKSN